MSSSPTTSTTSAQAPSLLRISPQTFQFTASKVSSGLVSKLKVRNMLQTPVGYKFKTNAPLRYSVKPVLGVLAPGQSIEVFVRCESWVNPQDRFLLQSVALGEEESLQIDAVSWRELDRRRIIENFIQCSSSSSLIMRDPQDDMGSLSSTSTSSSTRSSLVSSAASSSDKALRQQRLHQQQQPQHVQSQSHGQRVAVAHVHAAGRKMSTSSAASSIASSPGSYPTMFPPKGASAPSRLSTSASSKGAAPGSGISPMAIITTPASYLATKFSSSNQTFRTVSRFLAVRHYTKMQVFTVSVVCLMLGLLLPLEKLFFFANGHTSIGTATTQFRAGFVGQKAVFAASSSSSSSSSRVLPILVTTTQAGSGGETKNAGSPDLSKMNEIVLEQTSSKDTRQDEPIVLPIVEVEGAL